MSVRRDFPDIPPLWAAGTFVLQIVLSRLPLAQVNAKGLGWACALAGFALVLWSAWWFWRKRTTIEPRDTPSTLIVEGPFRLNRNPIYTGMAVMLVGTGLWLGSLLAAAFAFGFAAIITRRFILEEEDALRQAFGAQATDYITRTRRW